MSKTLCLLVGLAFGVVLVFALPSFAQTLQPVTDGGINWWPIVLAVSAALTAVVVVVILLKRNPNASVVVQSEASDLTTKLAAAIHELAQTHADVVSARRAAEQEQHGGPSLGGATATPTVAVGKINNPGTFTIEVSGDPATDMALINAKYFG